MDSNSLTIKISQLALSNSAHVPLEIIIEILSWLPVKTLLRLRCLGEPWESIISDARFVQKHLAHMISRNHLSHYHLLLDGLKHITLEAVALDSILGFRDNDSIANPPRSILQLDETLYQKKHLHPLGSCDGLILLRTFDKEQTLIIWNPSTRETKILPKQLLDKDLSKNSYKFGYDSLTNDYKVLMTFERQVALYSSRANYWKRVPDLPCDDQPCPILPFCNNVFIWMITDTTEEGHKKFMSFDLMEESFQLLPLPAYQNPTHPFFELGVLGGDLCATYTIGSDIDMWVMKEFGVNGKWVKIHTIPMIGPMLPRTLGMWGDEIVLASHLGIIIFNNKSGAIKIVVIKDLATRAASTYVESLVSPTGEGQLGPDGEEQLGPVV